jgi:hypothetical protein
MGKFHSFIALCLSTGIAVALTYGLFLLSFPISQIHFKVTIDKLHPKFDLEAMENPLTSIYVVRLGTPGVPINDGNERTIGFEYELNVQEIIRGTEKCRNVSRLFISDSQMESAKKYQNNPLYPNLIADPQPGLVFLSGWIQAEKESCPSKLEPFRGIYRYDQQVHSYIKKNMAPAESRLFFWLFFLLCVLSPLGALLIAVHVPENDADRAVKIFAISISLEAIIFLLYNSGISWYSNIRIDLVIVFPAAVIAFVILFYCFWSSWRRYDGSGDKHSGKKSTSYLSLD